jgi:hypothetical protein
MISMTSKPSMAVVAYIQARAMPMSLVWVVYLREQTIPLRRKDTENSKRFMENLLVGQEKKQRQGFPPTPPEKQRGQIVPIHLAKA